MTIHGRQHLALARFDLPAAAVGSSWLMLWLAGSIEPADRVNPALHALGHTAAMGLITLVALGLIGGYLWIGRATTAAMAMLLGAIAAAMGLGQASGALALLAAAGVLLHNVVGRYVPAVGVVLVGLTWAAGMAIVNPKLGFGHPIALAMTHVMGCSVLLHLYDRRRPRLTTESGALIGIGWAFWILLGVSLIGLRRQSVTVGQAHAMLWIGPMAALAAWVGLAAGMVRRGAASERIKRAGTLWLLVYAAAWLIGEGLIGRAMGIAGLAAAAWVMERWRRGRIAQDPADVNYRIA